ncbi:MAG: hypothetical protein JSV44_06045, partial [Candidatus Zixiibacteriota bacterium]
MLIAILIVISVSIASSEPVDSTVASAYPLNIHQDKGEFTLYLSEKIILRQSFEWAENGDFASDYTITVAGQSSSNNLRIQTDTAGLWNIMSMETPRGRVAIIRMGDTIVIQSGDDRKTLALRPGTMLFEDYSPALMSQAIIAYDRKLGGKQSFPLFIIPSAVIDASLERLETVEKFVMGKLLQFTQYRYGLPGVDVIVWVDEQNR